jgi:hypothetical protein
MTPNGPHDDEAEDVPRHLTLEDRVRLLERDTRAHARSIGEIVGKAAGLMDRLISVEEWKVTRLISEAREEERDKALYSRLDRIDESIKSMRGAWSKIMWIAAATIIPAVVIGVAALVVQAARTAGGAP